MVGEKRFMGVNYLIVIILISVPIIQLGITYYLSISFLIFLIGFGYSSTKFFNSLYVNKYVVIALAVFFVKIFTLAHASVEYRAILLPAREMVCAIGIILMSAYITGHTLN